MSNNRRIPGQGKVHQMADRPEGDELPGGRQVVRKTKITRKAPSDQEGAKRREEHRVSRRLLCSLLAAVKAAIHLNIDAGGPE